MASEFYITNLDWGDNTPKDFVSKPKLLYDGIDVFNHVYETSASSYT